MAPTRLNTHTAAEKAFIVRKLAAFEPPRAIVAAFAAVFPQSTCNENDVLATDPETTVVAPELLTLFKSERERVLLDPEAAAPYISQGARLIGMDRQARFYVANNQFAEARAVWRQMAEEQGVVGGKGSGGKSADKDTATPEVKKVEVTRTLIRPAVETVDE